MTISRQVASLASVALGVVLITAKIIISIITGSLSILAEAFDAAFDLLAAGVTVLAVRIAERPPDENHPYGHARADNLGALAQTVLLVVTAAWILWHAGQRIFVAPAIPEVNVWALLVIVISLAINVFRVYMLNRATHSAASPSLAASIANFSIDMLGSLVVLLALLIISLREWLPIPFWLVARADALAAACVALLGLLVAWRLGTEAIRALMDDVSPDLNRRLISRITEIPDVIDNSVLVRTRFVGSTPYVEVTVGTQRDRSLEEAHRLADDVEHAVCTELDEAQVLVHVKPTRTERESYATAVYSIAQRLGLRIHNLDMYQLAEGVRIEMDLELPSNLTLAEAHHHSEELEEAIIHELPARTSVAIHLEPRRDKIQPAVRYGPVLEQVQHALKALPEIAASVSRTEALLTDKGTIVVLHCSFPGHTPLTEVHTRMACIEHDLLRVMPDIVRVQIDPEPLDEARPPTEHHTQL
jgi:cation diffusion facilitator family transporter